MYNPVHIYFKNINRYKMKISTLHNIKQQKKLKK